MLFGGLPCITIVLLWLMFVVHPMNSFIQSFVFVIITSIVFETHHWSCVLISCGSVIGVHTCTHSKSGNIPQGDVLTQVSSHDSCCKYYARRTYIEVRLG